MNALILLIALAAAGDEDPAVARGRRIYETGQGESSVIARIAGGSEVPAAVLPCVNCHGTDGRGRSEGGVTPSDIRYSELTKPYEVATAGGRRRAPYTDALLRRAVTMGIDSSGRRFDQLMPRFQMTRSDLDALVAYLHTLGTRSGPGIDEKSIRVAMLLPPENADAVRAAVRAATSELDAEGGIFGRSIDVRGADAATLSDAIRRETPFAVIAASISAEDVEVARTTGTPVLSLFSAAPVSAPDAAMYVRYLAPGAVQQARALARSARGAKRVAIVGASAHSDAAQAFRDVAGLQGIEIVGEVERADAVLFLETPAQLPAAGGQLLLFLASTAPRRLFSATSGFRCMVALPLSPADGDSRGGAMQMAALAAFRVIAEAARSAGRDLTQSTFLDAVDRMRGFRTGFTPPVTWSPTRRIGWTTVSVVTFSPDGAVIEARQIDGD